MCRNAGPAAAVRARLARRAVELVDPVARVFDDTGSPEDGTGSPGVTRRYCGTWGEVANCQIGVSVHEDVSEPTRRRRGHLCVLRRTGGGGWVWRSPVERDLAAGVGLADTGVTA
nr:transposase [Umezawaea beigongshangensis]